MRRYLNRLAAGVLVLAFSAAAYAEGTPATGSDQREADPQKRMERGEKLEDPKADGKPGPAERKKPNKAGKKSPRRKPDAQSGSAMPPRTDSMPVDPN